MIRIVGLLVLTSIHFSTWAKARHPGLDCQRQGGKRVGVLCRCPDGTHIRAERGITCGHKDLKGYCAAAAGLFSGGNCLCPGIGGFFNPYIEKCGEGDLTGERFDSPPGSTKLEECVAQKLHAESKENVSSLYLTLLALKRAEDKSQGSLIDQIFKYGYCTRTYYGAVPQRYMSMFRKIVSSDTAVHISDKTFREIFLMPKNLRMDQFSTYDFPTTGLGTGFISFSYCREQMKATRGNYKLKDSLESCNVEFSASGAKANGSENTGAEGTSR